MSTNDSAFRGLIDEMTLVLAPLIDAASVPEDFVHLLADLGWTMTSVPQPLLNLAAAGTELIDAIGSDPDELSTEQILEAIARILVAINDIRNRSGSEFPSSVDIDSFKQTIGRDLLDYCVVEYLLRYRFKVGRLLKLAGIIQLIQAPAAGLRQSFIKRQVEWARISTLLTDPITGFRETYEWDAASPQLAHVLSDAASALEAFGLQFSYFQLTPEQLAFANAGATQPLTNELGIVLDFDEALGVPPSGAIGLQLLLRASTNERGPALGILPYARLDSSMPVASDSDISLSVKTDADFTQGVALTLAPGVDPKLETGILSGQPAAKPAQIELQLKIPPLPDQPERVIVGTSDGSRVSVHTVAASAGAALTSAQQLEAFAQLALEKLRVVVKPSADEADSFVASFLGKDGISAEVSLAVRLSTVTGFHLSGSGGLEGIFPVNLRLGPIDVEAISVALKPKGQDIDLEIGASIAVGLGPLTVVIDRVGFALTTSFPDPPSGNLGPLDVGFDFLPPNGAGLSVDSAGVSGGGFLKYEDAKHEYSGVLQLTFTEWALQAFGLITTQVPGGDGYALLALIDANFTPIQLGWGFTLNGVGGLLAVNRTASVDALRAGLKADALSKILFPKNAIVNAPQILAQLDSLFPVAPGRYLFGPMALIGWGTPTLLTAALAIIIELPEPIRIILLARLAARIPSESDTLIRINMDALGVLDLSQSSLALDATLFDSRLLSFTLSGDMALRANWGAEPHEFLLSVGGFHPRFTPPSGFPSLKRMSLDMPSGAISTLHLESYLAITSNTLQIGADLHVKIGVSAFSIDGHLGFDALFQRNPFHFDGDISGSVAISIEGEDFLSVSLDATLTGPAPWNIAGNFKVHIVFFDVHKSFSETWGDDAPTEQIAGVDVGALLGAELADPRSWGAQLPDGTPALVTTRDVQNTTSVIVHPLARLTVHERTVPLGLNITRFGAAPLSGTNHFAITDFHVGEPSVQFDAVEDDFAAAQFFDLTDDEKLAQPSFERHDAGVQFRPALPTSGTSIPKTITYETFFVDQPGGPVRTDDPQAPKHNWLLADLEAVLNTGSAATASIMRAGDLRYPAPGNPIRVAESAFVVVDTGTLAPVGLGPVGGNVYSHIRALLNAELSRVPAQRHHLQIVATHELMVA